MMNVVVIPLACVFAGHRDLVTSRDLYWQLLNTTAYTMPVITITIAMKAFLGHWSSLAFVAASGAVCLLTMCVAATATHSTRELISEILRSLARVTKPTNVV